MDVLKSIQDIFGVFAVGIFALMCIYILYCIAFKPPYPWKVFLKDIHQGVARKISKAPLTFIAILCIFLFGFGLIIQDIADKYTDSIFSGEGLIGKPFFWINSHLKILKSESDHRFSVLLKKDGNDENNKDAYTLTPLGRDIFKHKNLFTKPANFFNEQQRKFFDLIEPKIKKSILISDKVNNKTGEKVNEGEREKIWEMKSVKIITSTIYYRAKNWAFSQSTYYDELKDIQIRVDFSRSIALITILTVIGLIIAVIIAFSKNIYNKSTRLKNRYLLKNAAITLIILIVIGFFSKTSYDNFERNFNERVVGYFAGYLDNYFLYYPGRTLPYTEPPKTVTSKDKIP